MRTFWKRCFTEQAEAEMDAIEAFALTKSIDIKFREGKTKESTAAGNRASEWQNSSGRSSSQIKKHTRTRIYGAAVARAEVGGILYVR